MSKKNKNSYGLVSMLFDLLMIIITGGLWLIIIVVREIRKSR